MYLQNKVIKKLIFVEFYDRFIIRGEYTLSKKDKSSKFMEYFKTTAVYEFFTIALHFIKNHHGIVTVIVIAIFAVGIATYPIVDKMFNDSKDLNHGTPNKEEKLSEQKIFVTVSGEVLNPGMYEMSADTRINDAIQKAGGFTPDAFTENINLAQKLSDGQYIHIISKEYAENMENNTESFDTKTPFYGIININTASVEELCQLPGIGEKTAKAIIEYRELAGDYECIEDIQNVEGIGPKKFESIKYNITV